MRRNGLMATMLVLSLAFVCLIAAPILAVEDPWDVDTGSNGHGGIGDGGDPPDTTDVVIIDIADRFGSAGDGSGDWVKDLVWQASLSIVWDLYTMFGDNETIQAAETPTAK